jgi:hypothetical protein
MSVPTDKEVKLAFWHIAEMVFYHSTNNDAINGLLEILKIKPVSKWRIRYNLDVSFRSQESQRAKLISKFLSCKIGDAVCTEIKVDPLAFITRLEEVFSEVNLEYELNSSIKEYEDSKDTIKRLIV